MSEKSVVIEDASCIEVQNQVIKEMLWDGGMNFSMEYHEVCHQIHSNEC